MKQKEIWLADLNPTKGHEQQGVRPVIIISGNAMNDHSRKSIICPITSKIKNYTGGLILQKSKSNGLKKPSEVLTHQIRMVSQERLIQKWGAISDEELEHIKTGLNKLLYY